MITSNTKFKIYDLFQKTWTATCMSATIICMATLLYETQKYIFFIKPLNTQEEEKLKNELLKEGRMLSENLQSTNYT
jgi:hypothetical protein